MFFRKKEEYPTFEANSYFEDPGQNKNFKRSLFRSKVMIVISIYIFFLIVGMVWTEYRVNDKGEKEACIVSIKLKEERKSYYELNDYYDYANKLLILIKEYESEITDETYFEISVKYQNLLDDLEGKLMKLKAVNVDSKYNALQEQLEEEIGTNIAVYIQKMIKYLIESDETAESEAAQWKTLCISGLDKIELNLQAMARLLYIEDDDEKEESQLPEFDTKLRRFYE